MLSQPFPCVKSSAGRLVLILICLATSLHTSLTQEPCNNPVYCYGDLLDLVQRRQVFPDSKTFVDRPLRESPEVILSAFRDQESSLRSSTGALDQFVRNWTLPANSDLLQWTPDDWVERPSFIGYILDPEQQLWAYGINDIWKSLGRQLDESVGEFPNRHSLVSVPHPFIVPGGRFGEYYYWDTYWIVQGLLLSEMKQTAMNMVLNLVSLVERYGKVPTGGRVYYTDTSQPPLLTPMVDLVYSQTEDKDFLARALPSLVKEHDFWMGQRVTEVNGHRVNRYGANTNGPRPQSYREDIATAEAIAEGDRPVLYTELASAQESGWDFSSRWQTGQTLSTTQTSNFIPVDLNSVLCHNEATIAKLFRIIGNISAANTFDGYHSTRQTSFNLIFWNETDGIWKDWDLAAGLHTRAFYTSSLVPLVWSCDTNITQHKRVLERIQSLGLLDFPGGVPTSLTDSGQQWDWPNVWPPHTWFPVLAWIQSHDPQLSSAAREMADKWLTSTYTGWLNYNNTMFEKYNCSAVGLPGSGGEYVIQAGFGWTNGVTLHLLHLLSPPPSPSLGWVAVIVLLVIVTVVTVPLVVFCRRMYITGEKRYMKRTQRTGTHIIEKDSDVGDLDHLVT